MRAIKTFFELKLHCQIYKRNQKLVQLFTHQMFGSIVAAAQVDVQVLDEITKIYWVAEVIKAAPMRCQTQKITMATAKAIENSNAALMSNHGEECIGKI
ncbi:MAG: class II aldolase/adducin family protein [Bacteroidetes bacterium]|nr:class II aldolase/adducin family protein [Bacteroidota bacterium]